MLEGLMGPVLVAMAKRRGTNDERVDLGMCKMWRSCRSESRIESILRNLWRKCTDRMDGGNK